MVGDVIFVHRFISIVEAFIMVFEYLASDKQREAVKKDLKNSFPDAFAEAEQRLELGGDLWFLFFQIISFTSPQDMILKWLLKTIEAKFPKKQFEVFALALCFGYRHYGIETYSFNVVHFTGSNSNLGNDARVKKTTRKDFLVDGKLSLDLLVEPKFSRNEIADRALGLLGEDFGGYNVFKNNCEHFTSWCATDSRDSRQAMWWNEKIGPIKAHWHRLKDFLWDLMGEQANRLRQKAEEDEKYSAELIEILVTKRIEFERKLNQKTSQYQKEFSRLNSSIASCIAKEDYDGTRKTLISMAKLFNVKLEHSNFEEFKNKLANDDRPLIL